MPVGPETLRIAEDLRAQVGAQVDAETRRLVQAWARALDELLPELDAAALELATAARDGRWPTAAQVARNTRATRALQLAADELTRLAAAAEVAITNAAGEVVDLTVQLQPRLIAAQLPATAGTTATLAVRFDRVAADTIEAIVVRSTEQITALTRPLSAEATERMRRALVRGVPVGENPRVAASRMLAGLEGEFTGGLTRALVIARTEMLDAHRAGAKAQQQANADVLAGWVWQAELDTRTCPSCLAQHGTQHPLEEDGPLDHQQGRCSRLPVTKTWRELGFDLDEPPSALPDSRAWFDGLPEADQLAMMGAGRLHALQSGRAAWEDLSARRSTAGWRDSFGVTPVKALQPA